MKILQAFDFLSLPHGGGTVDIVYKLSKALSARGHDVTLCTGSFEVDWKYLSGLGNVGLKLYRSYFNSHGIYVMPDLFKLDVRDYDIIHLHCYRSLQNIVLARKAVKYSVPYIVDAHGSTVPRTGRKTLLLGAYDQLAGKKLIDDAKLIIAETGIGVAEWERLGAGKDKIRLQHPLLDITEFTTIPPKGTFRRQYYLKNSIIILFLGRIHQAKGIDTLLMASRGLLLDRDAVLVIAGQDDGYKNALIKLAVELGVPHKVVFTGYLGGKDKLAALVDADVLVQPSRNEAGARPSLEAIMCSTPVVVSRDTGAGEEIAKFDGGLLFKSGDAGELAKAITETIDNPEEAQVRTAKTREYIVENLSLENGIVNYERLYQEAVG
jgi:glycosyltransferase involved in cell wall biosynthesis